MTAKEIIDQHKGQLDEVASSSPFYVFLCGPTLNDLTKESAAFRARLRNALQAEKFEVILGEDDGLEDARLNLGMNAQDNELEFISSWCNAVIIVADSVGSFCELGLFSWHFVHRDGWLNNAKRPECVVLVDKKYEGVKSYLNEGPGSAVNGFGLMWFVNFAAHDVGPLVRRLKDRRGIIISDNKHGRPRKPVQ